jgi:glycosyltransferase involved in cell wall biosynthesis
MSCGIPCVAFNCKYGPEDIIEDGVDGLLVEGGNVRALAEKMLWMITHEKQRLEMGKRARQSVARYSKEVVMKEWERVYLSVLDSKY